MTGTIEKIYSLLEPILDGTDIFIVNIVMSPVNDIKVYLDADSGLSIDKCSAVSRKLYVGFEEMQLFPEGDFALEVSSPGIEEPLCQLRQYKKNIGRKVAVTLNNGTEKTGILKEVTDNNITIEIKEVKQKVTITTEISFSDIKKTVVQINF